ncbi:THAP domain-containing protein 6 [Exaiptasia diaphana]|uniref:THAP-type domain-containing protein n=1 Tax=Exaiptasia diaphana TaxID=2652724 RepID=A0A913YKB9_EXADI|nr:THAP domain-containing protein 6 [Exaiptasia diaphana]
MPNRDHCSVPLCQNNRSKKTPGVTFHTFPKDKALKKQWIIKIKRDIGRNFAINASTRICSKHFLPSQLKKSLGGKTYLEKGAIPSIFPWSDESKTQRKSPKKRVTKDKQPQAAPEIEIEILHETGNAN